jgi:hypothetical protein
MRILAILFLTLWLSVASSYADGDPSVVISMRQYLIEGSSRIHLYLYGMDGVFKKALTNDPGFNDLEPAFDYEGKTILFRREAADKAHETQAGQYVVDVASGTIRRYDPKNDYFSRNYPDMFDSAFAPGSKGWVNINASVYHSSEGQFTISANPNPKPDTYAPPDNPGNIWSVQQGDKPALAVAGLPGFIPAQDIDYYESFFIGNGSPFITAPGMTLAFLRHHLGSTDGEEVWGLDLTTMKGAKISGNGAAIYHPPSAPGVYVVSDALYQPLGKTGKTVNCSYLEWWDAHLKETRFGPDLSVCDSAAIYAGENANVVIP